ncbi:hypothetical protein EG328_001048 [Venturia inaequalis]|uniref:Uncharacterized protein n=1 Tax=Venturia inaequalis TaxID=5025 RepID=A0A8H3Z3D0_VENIN|nr:hypothetical protein EG328_001048 [Venturia inaequalis]
MVPGLIRPNIFILVFEFTLAIFYGKVYGISIVEDDESDSRHARHARRAAPVDKRSPGAKLVFTSTDELDEYIDSKVAKKFEEHKLAAINAPSFVQAVEKPSPPPLVAPAWAPRPLYVKHSKRQDRPELLDYRIEIDEDNTNKIFTNDGKIPREARWCRYHYDGNKKRGFDRDQHKGCLPRKNHLPCELQHDLDDCEDFALDLTPDNQLEEMVLRSAYMDVNKGKQWPNVDAVLADICRRKVSPNVKGIAKKLGMEPWPKPRKSSLRAPRGDYKGPNLINDKESSSIWNAEFMKNEEERKQKQLAGHAAKLAEDKAKKAQ